MAKKPQKFSAICTKNQQLKAINARVNHLSQLNTLLLEVLPEQFRHHCRLANVSANSLIIHTDNASLASLLRFQTQQICQALSEQLISPVNKLEVKVRPTLLTEHTKTKTPKILSKAAANSLQQTADILKDCDLKQALLKLSQRGTN